METVADSESLATLPEFSRRHRFHIYKQVVQTAHARKATLIGHLDKALTTLQKFFCMNGGNELKKTFRADPGPTLEESLEMVFTQADCPGYFQKSRLALKIIFYKKYSAFDALVIIL
jgi:hypothetical protein